MVLSSNSVMYLMKEKEKPTESFRVGLQSQKSCCEHYFSKSQEDLRETIGSVLKKIRDWSPKLRAPRHELAILSMNIIASSRVYMYSNIPHSEADLFVPKICITKYSKVGFISESEKLPTTTEAVCKWVPSEWRKPLVAFCKCTSCG